MTVNPKAESRKAGFNDIVAEIEAQGPIEFPDDYAPQPCEHCSDARSEDDLCPTCLGIEDDDRGGC